MVLRVNRGNVGSGNNVGDGERGDNCKRANLFNVGISPIYPPPK